MSDNIIIYSKLTEELSVAINLDQITSPTSLTI